MKNCVILIQTCDKYEKFWNGFFNFFKKNWDSEIESSIYFSNENKEINLPKNIKLIRIKIKVLKEVYQNILYSGMSKDSFIFR